MPHVGDELHHFGWNACSSCINTGHLNRTHLVVPTLNSNRIYVVNVHDDPKMPFLEKVQHV